MALEEQGVNMHGFAILGQTGLVDGDGTLLKCDVISCLGEWLGYDRLRLYAGDVRHDFSVEGCEHMSSIEPRSYLVAVDFSKAQFCDQLVAFSPFSVALPTSQWRRLY